MLPIDLNWLDTEYAGQDIDAAKFFVERARQNLIKELSKNGKININPEEATMKVRLDTEAYMRAARQSKVVKDTAERAHVRILDQIRSNDLFRNSKEEYQTFHEFLMDRIPEYESDSELSNLLFMLEEFLPILAQLPKEFQPDSILKMGKDGNFTRAKAAVPMMRKVVDEFNSVGEEYNKVILVEEKKLKNLSTKLKITSPDSPRFPELMSQVQEVSSRLEKIREEQTETLRSAGENFRDKTIEIIEVVTNKSVPAWGPGGVMDVLKKGETKIRTHSGYELLAPNGETTLMITIPMRYVQLFKTATRGFAIWDVTDPKIVLKDFSTLYFGGKDENR